MDTPQIDDVIVWLGAVAAGFVAIVAAMVILKKWLLSDVSKDIEKVNAQLHRNGGTSLRDAMGGWGHDPRRAVSDSDDVQVQGPRVLGL